MGSHLSRCTLWASFNERNSWRLSDQCRGWKRLDRYVTPDAFGFGPSTPAYGDNRANCAPCVFSDVERTSAAELFTG